MFFNCAGFIFFASVYFVTNCLFSDNAISIENGTFSWSQDERPTLHKYVILVVAVRSCACSVCAVGKLEHLSVIL